MASHFWKPRRTVRTIGMPMNSTKKTKAGSTINRPVRRSCLPYGLPSQRNPTEAGFPNEVFSNTLFDMLASIGSCIWTVKRHFAGAVANGCTLSAPSSIAWAVAWGSPGVWVKASMASAMGCPAAPTSQCRQPSASQDVMSLMNGSLIWAAADLVAGIDADSIIVQAYTSGEYRYLKNVSAASLLGPLVTENAAPAE